MTGTAAARFEASGTIPDRIDVTFDATHCSSERAVILYGAPGDGSGYDGSAEGQAGNTGTAAIDGSGLNDLWFNVIWASGTGSGHPGFAFDGTAGYERSWKARGYCSIMADSLPRNSCP
jgi:hypothetical protein